MPGLLLHLGARQGAIDLLQRVLGFGTKHLPNVVTDNFWFDRHAIFRLQNPSQDSGVTTAKRTLYTPFVKTDGSVAHNHSTRDRFLYRQDATVKPRRT